MNSFEKTVQQTWPSDIWGETRTLVAISGGADSVALLRALLRLAPPANLICAAHFNHGWRGQESDCDEQFVVDLCGRLNVPLQVGRARLTDGQAPDREQSVPANVDQRIDKKGTDESPSAQIDCTADDADSTIHRRDDDSEAELPSSNENRSEERARDARYAFLTRTAYQCGARYVVTAHTGSDRVETLLHNLFRGTGLAGASSPSLLRNLDHELVLVRPMLACTRQDVMAYLGELQQPFCIDSSNENVAYRRNFIRHELLPQIRAAYGDQADARILSFSEIVEESYTLHRSLAAEYLQQAREVTQPLLTASERSWNAVAVPSQKILPAAWPVVRQALVQIWNARHWPLQKMGRDHWDLIRRHWESLQNAAPANSSTYNLPGNLTMRCCRDMLLFGAPLNNRL